MLIDIVEGILTSNEGSRMILKQGNFERVKRAALYERIIHNQKALTAFINKYNKKIRNKGIKQTFESLTNNKLEEFYSNYSVQSNPYAATYGLKAMKNLMDGNSLIGITAVSSSNHYKLQFCDVTLSNKWAFTITDTVDGELKTIDINKVNSVISPYTGELISDIGSEYQAAAPDNGKDPCLGDAGLNPNSASFYLFLKDLGIPPQIASIIGDSTLKPEKLSREDAYEIASKGFKNFDLNIEKLFQCVIYLNTKEDLRSSLPFTIDEKYLEELKGFIKGLMYIAQIHDKISAVSRADSTNGALGVDIPSVYRQRLAVIQLLDIINQKDCPFINLNKLVNPSMELSYDKNGNIDYRAVSEKIMKTAVPRLQAAFTLGIKSGMEMAAKWLPTLNNTVLDGLIQLQVSTGRYFTSKYAEKHLRAFCEELFTAMLSTNPLFGTNDNATLLEKRNYYVYAFPLKYSSFINDEAHKDIRNLNIIRRITYNNGKGIKFTSVGKIGKLQRIQYVEEVFSLLENKDAEVRAFGRDLFLYCYFATGMKFGRDNFGIFFGSAFYKAVPEFIERLRASNTELNNGTFNMDNFVDQFLLNHAELLPRIYNSKKEIKYKTEDNGNKAIIFEVTDCNDTNGDPYKYVVINYSVYRYVSIDTTTGQVIYEKAKYNKLGNSFYDMSISADDIQFDKLLSDGPVVGTSTINKGKQVLSAKHNYLTNTKKATFFSGAARGADTYWSSVAARYGIKTTNFEKDYYDKASTKARSKMDEGIANVAHHLNESIPTYGTLTYKLFARDIAQSRAAEGIFAIARINEQGKVEGGTRVAVYDAILSLTKPVYVFDMNTNQWNVYDHISGEFKPCKEPRLLEKSAVIGSRELTDEGKQAIRDILKHSMEKVTKVSEDNNTETPETPNTSIKQAPKDPRAQFKGKMDKEYNGHQAEGVTADNTLDAIINGERTATTRYDYNRTHTSPAQSNTSSEDVIEGVQTTPSYYEGNITPEKDTIFVFGSNPEGRHGAGAARIAREQFGAKYGVGEGLTGNAYALPTKDLSVKFTPFGKDDTANEPLKEGVYNVYYDVKRSTSDNPVSYLIKKIKDNKVTYVETYIGEVNGQMDDIEVPNSEKTVTEAEFRAITGRDKESFTYSNSYGFAEVHYTGNRTTDGHGIYSIEINILDDENQGKGIGSKMYEDIIDKLAEQGDYITPGNVVETNHKWEALQKQGRTKEVTLENGEHILVAIPKNRITQNRNYQLKSISEKTIIENIKKLYRVARQNPNKQFKVAYRNTDKASLNGYTGLEMIDMFLEAGNIPSNIVFSKEWIDTGKFNSPNTSSEDVVEDIQTTSVHNGRTTIQYTPKGKQRQTYTIVGNKIYNKEGKEVFKTDSVDRNKIFANLAVQQGRAVVVEYKDRKYVVNNRNQIISVATGKIMQWGEENGNRKNIIEAAKTKFATKTAQQTDATTKKTNSTIDYWKQAKVGDIIQFNDNNGRAVLVRMTKPLQLLSLEKGKGEKVIT